jgi:tetratricopeptide (TPR) repeat protein
MPSVGAGEPLPLPRHDPAVPALEPVGPGAPSLLKIRSVEAEQSLDAAPTGMKPNVGEAVAAVSIDDLGAAIKPASFLEGKGQRGVVQSLATEPESPSTEKPLEPIPDPQNIGPVEIEAASFNGVTPGVTSIGEVQKAWGQPKEATSRDNMQIHLYSVGPFDRVEVTFYEGRASSIVIRLTKPFPADAVAKQLQLLAIRPVFVSNALGEILGQSYPERGVLFAFEPSETPGKPSMKVSQIILEAINAEPFVLRAETNIDTFLESSAKDLEAAVKLDPANARAYWLQARVLFSLEQLNPALTAASESVRLEPENPQYRVTRAQVLGQLGQFSTAIEEAQRAGETSEKRPHIRAQAICMLGDLYGSGEQPDYKKAMAMHMEARTEAEALIQNPHPAIRVAAKEVLMNACLGAAHDIAWGNWNQKDLAVTKWLEEAVAVADDLVDNEHASPEHRFRVAVRALAASVGVQGKLDPTPWAEMMVKSAEAMITANTSDAQKQRLQWDLAMALYDAVQIYQMRKENDLALKFGQLAIQHLETNSSHRETADDYLLARLYFRMGAIQAIGKEDHKAAVEWFDKAVPLFNRAVTNIGTTEFGRLGETYVSMGVSYWETGSHEKAVELTGQGIGLIEQMVRKGAMESSSLEIPYKNLAAMHQSMGQNSQAEAFLQKASKLKSTTLR